MLLAIAADIIALTASYPQLRAFEKTALVSERDLSYVYRAAPDPKIKAGWRRGYPLPKKGGVVIGIRLMSDEQRAQMQQADPQLWRVGDEWLHVIVLDGEGNKPLAGPIHEILKRRLAIE
jgi:hypothetical protein